MKKLYLLATAVLLAVASPGAQGKRFITEHDLFKFTWIADPQISPDGTTVAFVRVTVNEKDNRYETSLFTVPAAGGDAPRRLTSGTRDTTPRWAPDGKRIVFVRAVEKDGKPQPGQIYLLQMDGGEARPITDVAGGAGNPVWSPDGTRIAFTQRDRSRTIRKPAPDHKSDVEVVTRAVYRANGNPGYVDNDHHAHLFTMRGAGRIDDARHARSPTASSTRADRSGRPTGRRSTSPRPGCPNRTIDELGDEIYAVPASGGAIDEGRRASRAASATCRCRPTASGSPSSARCAASRSAPTASRICSGSRTSAARRPHAEEPDRRLRFRHRRRHRRRSVGAARRQNRKPIVWSPRQRVAARRRPPRRAARI